MPGLPIDQILTGDCIELMDSLPESSVDLIFADPPYNLQLRKALYRPNLTKVAAVDDEWDQFTSLAEYDAFSRAWLTSCRRLLKDTGTLWVIGSYHNIYRLGALLQDLDFWILNDVVWIKSNPMPNFRGVRFTNAHETLIWVQKNKGGRYTFNHHAMKALNDDLQMRSDWWNLPLATGKERIKQEGVKVHSAQKPEALIYRVLLATSNPGDVVLDPFFGSGTTGAVAKKLRRHFIGIERDPEYVRIARERIDAIALTDLDSLAVDTPKTERIPFGALLEHGLLSPGQALYFSRSGEAAQILSNGHIRCGKITGSIHAVARALMDGVPANGWELWMFEDAAGKKRKIDELRLSLRGGGPNE
jgi:modification methylase